MTLVYKGLAKHRCYGNGFEDCTSGGVTASVNVFASDGFLYAGNSSFQKGFADLARAVLARVVLS